jgi:hypothetical protein
MTEPVVDAQGVLRAVTQFYEENSLPGFGLAKYKTKEDLDGQASWWRTSWMLTSRSMRL